MIDHLMTFPDEASAMADPVVGQYYVDGSWRGDCCLPGIFLWSQAANTTVVVDGQSSQIRHPFDSNWRIIIARSELDSDLSALPSCHLITDRDAALAGHPFILQSAMSLSALAAISLEPTFAGSTYPFGNPS